MKTWIIAAALGIALSAAGASGAFAQAGSTGGTIGKQDKSVSGSADIAKPRQPAEHPSPSARGQSKKETSPQSIRFEEHGSLGNYSATLRLVSGTMYEATWNVAVTSRMTVILTDESMTVHRQDTSNPFGLASGTYFGKRNGRSASGKFNISPNSGTWEASW